MIKKPINGKRELKRNSKTFFICSSMFQPVQKVYIHRMNIWYIITMIANPTLTSAAATTIIKIQITAHRFLLMHSLRHF
jgi:hypothetical protein